MAASNPPADPPMPTIGQLRGRVTDFFGGADLDLWRGLVGRFCAGKDRRDVAFFPREFDLFFSFDSLPIRAQIACLSAHLLTRSKPRPSKRFYFGQHGDASSTRGSTHALDNAGFSFPTDPQLRAETSGGGN